jgi:acid stress-induced BolA-like protein IbaG/YrbA
MSIVQPPDPARKPVLFYVYVLYRPDGRPFYVGKGHGRRINAHEQFAKMGHKARRYSIIRKIWREGGQVVKEKVFETYDELEAYAMERQLIASIGRENLTNETDGGDGNYGWSPSLEQRARLSEIMKGRIMSPEWRANIQAAKIGKPKSEACKEKIRAALTGRTLPPEHVEHAAAGHRGQKRSEQARQNISEGLRGKKKPNLQGEKHFAAVLTVELVKEMRRLKRAGATYQQLADQFGIAVGTLAKAVSGQTWKHVEE